MSIVLGYTAPGLSVVATDTRRKLAAGGFTEAEKLYPFPTGWMGVGGRTDLAVAVMGALWRSAPDTYDDIAATAGEACAPLLSAERGDGGARFTAAGPGWVLKWNARGEVETLATEGVLLDLPELTTDAEPGKLAAEILDEAEAVGSDLGELVRFLARTWERVEKHTDRISTTVELQGFVARGDGFVPVSLSAPAAEILRGVFRVQACEAPTRPPETVLAGGARDDVPDGSTFGRLLVADTDGNNRVKALAVGATLNEARFGLGHTDTTLRSHNSDTAETTLETITIPAGALATNGGLRLTGRYLQQGTSFNKTLRIKFGGTLVASRQTVTPATIAFELILFNDGATNDQDAMTTFIPHNSNPTLVTGSATVDTTASVDLTITGQLGGTGTSHAIGLELTHLEYLGSP